MHPLDQPGAPTPPRASGPERDKVLYSWNKTEADYPRDATLHELFIAQAQRTPQRRAITFQDRSFTYAELDERSTKVALYLQSLGIGPESLVAFYVHRSVDMVVGLLGILKAGGAYIPLDPDFPASRIRQMLEDAQPQALLTQEALVGSSDWHASVTVCLEHVERNSPVPSVVEERRPARPENLAYVIYTSGSTGRPKGVQIPHRAAVNFLTSMQHAPGLKAEDRLLAVTTLSFDIALLEIFLPLITGAEVVIAPREAVMDGPQLQTLLAESDITVMQATPATWRLLLDTGWAGKSDLVILCGGEAMSADLAEKLLPRCHTLWNMYGPTETTVWSTVCRISEASNPISIGRPIANTQIYLLDEERQPVAVGAVGRMYIGGDGVARGYLNRPELTAERFLKNPFAPNGTAAARMYNTGDLARYLPDGRIEYLGRDDFQVKIRGFRIELGDVEAAVNAHSSVAYSLVMAREDIPGRRRLVAYLITEHAGQVPNVLEMRDFLRQTLPDYMVPERFVFLDSFPLLPNGKIDRRALPAPDRAVSELDRAYMPPRDELERAVADVCAGVLNLERVSVADSFFDLGGNSLLAAAFLSRLREQLSIDVSLRAFFAEPTVSALSRTVSAAREHDLERGKNGHHAPSRPALAKEAAVGDVDAALLAQSNLTRSQFLMWMGQQIYPDAPLYNVYDAVAVHGELDVAAFRRAFQALVDHHDVLRTTIVEVDGVPQQRVQEGAPARLELVDLHAHTSPQDPYLDWLAERKVRVLRLDQRLYDAALVKLAPDHFVWYLCQHHIVSDAVSAELLLERLGNYYRLALDGRLGDIAQPPQFAGFVRTERESRQSAAWQQAAAYWREKFAERLPATEFYGRSGDSNALQVERVLYSLGAARSAKLREIARQEAFSSPSEDMSLFTIFAALLFTTLHRLNGERTLRLGTPFHGRPTVASQQIAGLFLEMGALQVEVEDQETFSSLGEKVMAETLAALSHVQPGVSSADTNRGFDVVLNYIQGAAHDFAGLPITRQPLDSGYIDANHKLRLQVLDVDDAGSFRLAFDMKADLFGQQERQWLVDHFLRVLDAFIADPRRSLGDFSLLSEAEQRRLLVDFNATAAPYPSDRTVVALFEEQAAATPDAPAVVQDETAITYAALNARANRLAHYLREQGVGPETTVAICMERSHEALVAIFGVLKAGGAYIPIDPTYPLERIAYMLHDAAPAVILTGAENTLSALDAPASMRIVNLPVLDLSAYATGNPAPTAGPGNLVYMIYTSGSTGKPKGTMLTHRGLLNYVWWARRVYQQDRPLDFPLYSSLAFDLTVTSIFVPLLSGGKVVVYPESRETPGLEILTVFQDDAVDVVKLTPAHLGLVRELNLQPARIHKLIVGGEDFKTELALAMDEQFGGRVDMYNEYGPTEAVVGCMIHRFNPARDTAVSVPIGTPAANARIYLLDEYDQPVPPGVIGEMVISSDGVARGYHNRPELTAQRFDDDPFRPGARIYRTGDIARWNAEGQMVFLGRRDHQVKINSARIELGEIEAQLLAHPSVQDVIVRAVTFEPHPDAADIVHCVTCGLPSNYPNVNFDEQGVCSLCTDFDTFRDDVFRYFKTMGDLRDVVARAKAERSGDYDCMMLYSGGKDSTYVLGQLVEMGLKVLAFSLDNGYISEEAKENVRRVTAHLGVDLVFATTPHMNAIFADSLERYSNVCQGCYKTIYTLSMTLARQKGIKYIFTGLSRGQLFETRLDELFRNRIFDVAAMDDAVLEARKVYHRVDDAVQRLLDVSIFRDDRVFEDVQFVDYFRYTDVELDDLYEFLSTRVPWMRPRDTGRSTNCLINEAGIYVHQTERGYHNYALPYSWDVRLGHKTREEALEELDDEMRLPMVRQMLDEVGYNVKRWRAEQSEKRLAAYYVSNDDALTAGELRSYLAQSLPGYMIPAYLVRLQALPLTPNGKVDYGRLPNLTEGRPDLNAVYVAPQSPLETQLADVWAQTLNVKRVGLYDNFFDLGGASILAVQAVARISDLFDVTFPISSFFEHPTIAGQSAVLEELLIAQLEAMSDAEVEALLAEMGD